MGQVYRVEHLHTGEAFALKALACAAGHDPAKVERFMREARTPARIHSDHVVKVIDADVSPELDGSPFFVMELLDGVDLQESIRERGPLSADVVVEVMRQVAHALDRAHALDIVHRDLKPSNIYLHRRDADVVVKLLDFGISKLRLLGEDVRLTASGAIVGTPLYMPPEQAQGSVLVGPAADIWAMGMLAFKLLSGRPYWAQRSMADVLAAIVRDPLEHPSTRDPELPRAFDAWFFRSCKRSANERWSSAGEQVTALAAALGVVLDKTGGLSLSHFFDASEGRDADARPAAWRSRARSSGADSSAGRTPSRASTVSSGPRCLPAARPSERPAKVEKIGCSQHPASSHSCVVVDAGPGGADPRWSSDSSGSTDRRCGGGREAWPGARIAWKAVNRRN